MLFLCASMSRVKVVSWGEAIVEKLLVRLGLTDSGSRSTQQNNLLKHIRQAQGITTLESSAVTRFT